MASCVCQSKICQSLCSFFKLDRHKVEIFYEDGVDALEQVAQRCGRYPIPGTIQGQIAWVSGYLVLVEDAPDYCREIGLDGL